MHFHILDKTVKVNLARLIRRTQRYQDKFTKSADVLVDSAEGKSAASNWTENTGFVGSYLLYTTLPTSLFKHKARVELKTDVITHSSLLLYITKQDNIEKVTDKKRKVSTECYELPIPLTPKLPQCNTCH